MEFGFGRVENIVGKGENAGYQHFLLFPQCFQKHSDQGCLTLYQQQSFRLVQIESICRQQNTCKCE